MTPKQYKPEERQGQHQQLMSPKQRLKIKSSKELTYVMKAFLI